MMLDTSLCRETNLREYALCVLRASTQCADLTRQVTIEQTPCGITCYSCTGTHQQANPTNYCFSSRPVPHLGSTGALPCARLGAHPSLRRIVPGACALHSPCHNLSRPHHRR